MHLSEFNYHLPDDLIAQEPLPQRSDARMMMVDRTTNEVTNSQFGVFATLLKKGDVLVVNNTRVFPARLYGKTETGAAIEIFLIRELSDSDWEALARPGRRLKPGKTVIIDEKLTATVVEKMNDGKVLLSFDVEGDVPAAIDRLGSTPLPPYIHRNRDNVDADRERYQTVFASERGAIAAPTAGLHFTPAVLEDIRQRGVDIVEITLHVGYGTFEPVRVDDISEHRVQPEAYKLTEAATAALNAALAEKRRIVAVGTTSTRALESSMANFDRFVAGDHVADLTITPGYTFRAVSALLTNFHLPQSSLLILTSTFGGHELIMNAYAKAVENRYRFYSYGDCMLIV